MKCEKCGEEVAVQPGKSANFCFNCGNKIQAEKTSGWNYFDNTKDLLAHIASEYGLEALFSKKYLSDHASPMLPQGQKRLVSEAFFCGAVKILQDNMTADQRNKEIAVKQAMKKLTDLMFSQEAAERVVWEFTNAIGWGMDEPAGNAPAPQPDKNPSPSAPSPSFSDPDVDKLIILGWQCAGDGDWNDAADYFTRAREANPTYAPAFLGLLCVDLKVEQEDKLASIKDPKNITSHKHYKKIISDPNIKPRLDGYIQTINARIDAEQKAAAAEEERKRKAAAEAARRKRVQDAFDNAEKMMNSAKKADDYRKAITVFGSIDSNYHDINSQIKSKISECEKKIKALAAEAERKRKAAEEAARRKPVRDAFDDAERIMNAAQDPDDCRKAITAFESIDSNYQDINDQIKGKIAECEKKIKAMEDVAAALRSKYGALLDRLSAEGKAQADAEHKKWEIEASAIKAQAESWKSQGVCPHCGRTLKGVLIKKCNECGKTPGESIEIPSEPFKNGLPADVVATIKGEFVYVKLGGIDWRVLVVENNKALLISEKVLEKRPYNVKGRDITWEQCTLRKYLNNEFYDQLGAAKSAIAETRNSNPNNPWYGTSGGNATTDKVFLLSLDEVCRYFGDSTAELRNVRKEKYYFEDKNNSNRIANYGSAGASWWWLRSPGNLSNDAAAVRADGSVDVAGHNVGNGDGGVRPALWLNL